ncbi:MAG: alkaline phosphatase D family protein [Verrucomicrobia bacterium]|nr:alkaline phosphatase D family protein [Verrucomicrobiota bacterium]
MHNRQRWFIGALLAALAAVSSAQETRQATGVKVGEVAGTSAIVWTRLTAAPTRNKNGIVIKGKPRNASLPAVPEDLTQLEGACPGAPGQMRVRYGTREDLSDAQATEWAEVLEKEDFSHQFKLASLKPATVYHYAVETAGPGGAPKHGAVRGRFETAQPATEPSRVTFCVVTGQAYCDLDHADGFNIYPAMAKLKPQFIVFTGDNVYYDSEAPVARTIGLARYHWQRMYSLPRHVELLRNVASLWEKDDHDTLDDDCYPQRGNARGQVFSFAEGQRIFLQQAPMGEKPYRTFRLGRDLQVWLTEGRDFRSANNAPDGPDKTILGAEQKAWLKRTLKESDATWKVWVSPTPVVGPDRKTKKDNHTNAVFQHEGDELRAWLKENVPASFFLTCGDRHWQYHSVHPATGVQEFSCGPASDPHAGGSPGEDKDYHRFHRVKGGFLSVTIAPRDGGSGIAFRLHDVHGAVVYEWTKEAR